MSRRTVLAILFAMVVASFGLGCLKMEVNMRIEPNGSAFGNVLIGMEETWWNMSGGMNLSTGNLSLFNSGNFTTWEEGGWVYMKSNETAIPEENMSVEIRRVDGYTEYIVRANLSGIEQESSAGEEMNLSDPMTQLMLSTMTFTFRITMPGEIVEANTDEISGSVATWSYDGLTLQSAGEMYARSQMHIVEGLFLPFFSLGMLYLALRSKPRSG